MERIFANLYRTDGSNRRGTSHTYFLKRKEGNLLVSHQAPLTSADIDQIEQMGGLESQWVCHSHDLMGGGLHEELYDRFGCPLHYHRVDRPRVRKKTKCEAVEFDGAGTQHGADFEAFFLPTCTAGHSIYRWRSQGRYYLFTSHAIYQSDDKWSLQFNMTHREHWPAQLAALAKLRVDYLFPGYTAPDEDDFYRLDDRSQKSLSKALKAKAKPLPKPPQIVVLGPTAGMQLDCKFSQPPWNAVSPMKFVDRHGNTAQYGASVRTAWDDDHLYFACTNQEPEIESLKTLATAQDPTKKPAVWEDDTVEIFLCPDAEDRARCYQFIINAKGVILDVAYGESSNFKPDFTWSSGVEAKARIEKNRWLVEVRIPFKDLGISRPAQGRTIALNVYRNRYCDARVTHSCWSATGQRPPLTRERFGLMTLG